MSPRDFDKEAALPRFSLDRRITVLMLALTLAVVGTVATLGIPAEMLPRGFVGNWMYVYVPWQDSPPRETLEKLAIPLEEELATVRGINQMFSVSFNGGARVIIQFKQGSDMSVAYREVRDRVQRARVDFPDDVDEVYIRKDDASGFPVYAIGVAVDPDLENSYDLIQNEIITRLERLDGVASVNVFGLEEKEILIELDREKTNAAGLNIYQLAQQLGDDNFTMASGTVHSGPRKLLLRSVASYRSVEELEDRKISPSARLRDIAEISYDEPDKTYRARVNSMPAVALHVIGESTANTKELLRQARRGVREARSQPPALRPVDEELLQPGRGDRRVARDGGAERDDRRRDRGHRALLLHAPVPPDDDRGAVDPLESRHRADRDVLRG